MLWPLAHKQECAGHSADDRGEERGVSVDGNREATFGRTGVVVVPYHKENGAGDDLNKDVNVKKLTISNETSCSLRQATMRALIPMYAMRRRMLRDLLRVREHSRSQLLKLCFGGC